MLVDRGDLGGMSYGFIAGRGNSRLELRSGKPHRTITGIRKLVDVSLTADPAFVTAEASFRALALANADDPELLRELLDGSEPPVEPWRVKAAARRRRLRLMALTSDFDDFD